MLEVGTGVLGCGGRERDVPGFSSVLSKVNWLLGDF